MKKQYTCPQTEGSEIKAMINLLAGSDGLRLAPGGIFDPTIDAHDATYAM